MSTGHFRYGPAATCLDGCGPLTPLGEAGLQPGWEVREVALRHVREAGHRVETEMLIRRLYEPESPETRGES